MHMEKNKQNEELQSRREFFKKAAKSALPILGAVVLASAPGIATVISVALDVAQLASRAVQMAAPVVVLVALTANFSGTY